MNKKKWLIALPIIAVLWGLTIWGICAVVSHVLEVKDTALKTTYEGRIYFEDQADYSGFKQYLANHKDIIIDKLEVLSSPDPLVDFTLVANGNVVVPYGEVVKVVYDDGGINNLIPLFAFGLVGLPAIVIDVVFRLSLVNVVSYIN